MASFFDIRARKEAAAASASTPKATPSREPSLQPWVEKYRPKNLGDVTAQDHTITVLERTLQSTNLPHMLFYGPPGTGKVSFFPLFLFLDDFLFDQDLLLVALYVFTGRLGFFAYGDAGKTSTILALAKQLYGPELFKTRVLELNASDERGISIVREKVKNFARMQLSNPSPAYAKQYPCPPYKIIILDEADSMTQDAQSALRRTMETYSKITRFCLICNYVTRIIDPLASRCSKFRFKSLDQANAKKRLEEIAEMEGVRCEVGAVDALINCSEGDLRKAITFLQSAARLVGAVGKRKKGKDNDVNEEELEVDEDDAMDVDVTPRIVTIKIIEDIAGVIPDDVIQSLVKAMRPRSAGLVYGDIAKVVQDLVADGWSATQVVTQLYQSVIYNESIPDRQKNKIVMVFSETDKRLVDGSDEHLSILDLSLRISGIMAGA